MPWGLRRFHQSGQSHFVTFCCYHRRRLLDSDERCRIFESALERVRRSYRLYIYGYVVMPEHVHLLLSEPNGPTQAKGGLEWATRRTELTHIPEPRLAFTERTRTWGTWLRTRFVSDYDLNRPFWQIGSFCSCEGNTNCKESFL
jgi:REP element-mobilizing transposase RayT